MGNVGSSVGDSEQGCSSGGDGDGDGGPSNDDNAGILRPGEAGAETAAASGAAEGSAASPEASQMTAPSLPSSSGSGGGAAASDARTPCTGERLDEALEKRTRTQRKGRVERGEVGI